MSNAIDHKNLGEIQQHEYLVGTIVNVYPENADTPEEYWDTADVFIQELGLSWNYAPIFYHCSPDLPARDNGSVFSGAKGFTENDSAILLCEKQTAQSGSLSVKSVTVVGHTDGLKKCSYNYVIVRSSLNPLESLDLSDPLANLTEYCTVFDVAAGAMASIVDPDLTPDLIQFPCLVSKIKPFLQFVELSGVALFEEFPQGDDDIEIAGVIPSWKTDSDGAIIRAGAGVEEWWNTYDVDGNPVLSFFQDLYFGIMMDDEGASNGTYQETMDIYAAGLTDIAAWAVSPAFGTDSRNYAVTGSVDLGGSCIGPTGQLSDNATSIHIQTAFGEDEIWECAVNTYDGMVVGYCDSMTKFVRFIEVPPNIPIPGLYENIANLNNQAIIGMATPGAGGLLLTDLGTVLAGEASLAGMGGENSLWSYGLLKRINEGAFHRTIHPAMTGSMAFRTTAIPEDVLQEPVYFCALNKRWDKIEAWSRYDNWQNSFNSAYGSFGVDVIWWFRSNAQSWGAETIYADTPLGSMWFQSPDWKAAVWYMYQLGSCSTVARRDQALNQELTHCCKHSRATVAQLYIVQRTSITLWAQTANIFSKQEVGKSPYDSIPLDEFGDDSIAYVKMPDDSLVHIDSVTNAEIESVLSERNYIRSVCDDEDPNLMPVNEAFRSNRNEFEIMGAVDLYGSLLTDHQRRNPIDQVRCPKFERAVAKLLEQVMVTASLSFSRVYTDMEII